MQDITGDPMHIRESVAERQQRLAIEAGSKPADLQTRVNLGAMLTPEHFALEREKIFRRSWLPIGHTDDIPQPGSYFVQEVPTFNTSLIVVRGEDGKVRAFHNACRHRGNKLVREGEGRRKGFVCNFHGWAFTNQGRLQTITDEHMFEPVNKDDYALLPVHCEVWENLIFVNFEEQPRETLEQWLGPEFYSKYSGYWNLHEKVASYSFDMKANWHLGVNAFIEGYHTLYLHKNTARDYQGGKVNPLRHRPHMEMMKRHTRYSAPGNPDHRILPVEDIAIRYGRKMLPAFDFDSSLMPEGVNPSRYEYWAFDVVCLFPNFVAVLGNHFRAELTFWPTDEGRTLVLNRTYAYHPKNIGERLSQAYFRARGRDVVREDLTTLEAQQQMLAAGVLPHVLLSKQEMAVQHHFAVTRDMLEAA
jgi:Rieske 2Fe-2S family protein